MDSFELNKIAGAVLFTVLVILSLGILAETIYGAARPETPGFDIVVTEPEHDGPSPDGGGTKIEPIAVRLAKADVTAGTAAAKKCLSCFAQRRPAVQGRAEPVGRGRRADGPCGRLRLFHRDPAEEGRGGHVELRVAR
jgi:hypothetical protein